MTVRPALALTLRWVILGTLAILAAERGGYRFAAVYFDRLNARVHLP